jgi:hypothetical protein
MDELVVHTNASNIMGLSYSTHYVADIVLNQNIIAEELN